MMPTTGEYHSLSLTDHHRGKRKQKPPIAELFQGAQTEIRYNLVYTPGLMTNEKQEVHPVSSHTPILSANVGTCHPWWRAIWEALAAHLSRGNGVLLSSISP